MGHETEIQLLKHVRMRMSGPSTYKYKKKIKNLKNYEDVNPSLCKKTERQLCLVFIL